MLERKDLINYKELYIIILFSSYTNVNTNLNYAKNESLIICNTTYSHTYIQHIYSREKEGLLHKFEINETTKGARLPKADPTKTIKCFSRPAAGLNMTDMKQLRPAPVLLSTIRYLFTKYLLIRLKSR